MLSSAAAILLASALAARADDITISTNTDTALDTTQQAGNITIDTNGAVSVKNNGAAVTLDSNYSVTNSGVISNQDNTGAIGLQIDTTNGDILAQSAGISNYYVIQSVGDGTSKTGLLVQGGHTYFGNITFSSTSSLTTVGDDSSAFRLAGDTTIDGDVSLSGSISSVPTDKNPDKLGDSLILLEGDVNGDFILDSSTVANNVGALTRGLVVLGQINTCASDAANQANIGYTCSTTSGAGMGALVVSGTLTAVGSVVVDPKAVNLESGSALIIGNSIHGGVLIGGPATSNALTAASISSNGVNGNATVLIDPNAWTYGDATGIQGPINIAPVQSPIDVIDPGYSFINRGTINAAPADSQLSTAAFFLEGASTFNYTCLGNGDLTSCGNDGQGGLLDTGTITATAITNVVTNTATNGVTNVTTANAFVVGPYAYVPRLDLLSEQSAPGTFTPATISATVTGVGQGTADAVVVSTDGYLPAINLGPRSEILANVVTSTITPNSSQGSASSPFSLLAEAIVDTSGTLKTINNGGKIVASVTTLYPQTGAVALTTTRAVDLFSATGGNVTINNRGQILGDVLFPSGGDNMVLNVGNVADPNWQTLVTGNSNFGVTNTPNNYAIVAESLVSNTLGAVPVGNTALINFGSGTGNVLHVGSFGYVNALIESNPGGLDVAVDQSGILYIANTGGAAAGQVGSLNAHDFDIHSGGTLGLIVSQNSSGLNPVVKASDEASIESGATLTLAFGSFVSSGTTAASINNPATQNIVLVSAPTITDTGLAEQNAVLSENLPFLFQAEAAPLSQQRVGSNDELVLSLTPRAPGATNADGTPGLGLTGDALAQFPFVASALQTDPALGSAIASNLTVYNTPGVAASGINIPASQQQAQQTFSRFGPDTSGGARQVAIMLTDQATGPVADRQRTLRSFSDAPGDLTLWGQEFGAMINNKGRVDADGSLTNYKDHGFGFTLGMDSGSPQSGWYGGAFTFYAGDVTQTLPRDTQTHTQWYMLTGYTQWSGRHLFLDTQGSVSYGDFNGKRFLTVGNQAREADGKRAALMAALGANLGAAFHWKALEVDPHFSLDGMTMREEGYSEANGGDGFDLQVAPSYSDSLRFGFGSDFKLNMHIFDFNFAPEARVGYRYDFVNSPIKLKAAFLSTGGLNTVGNSMTFVGPDPDTGNVFGGLSLSAGTEDWHVGVSFDMLRGDNGSTTQIGTLNLLGRI